MWIRGANRERDHELQIQLGVFGFSWSLQKPWPMGSRKNRGCVIVPGACEEGGGWRRTSRVKEADKET